MTESRDDPRTRRRRPSTRPTTIKLTAASLGAAAVLTGGLAVQMASGHDPALGSGGTAGAPGSSKAAKSAQSQDAVNAAPAPATVVTRSS